MNKVKTEDLQYQLEELKREVQDLKNEYIYLKHILKETTAIKNTNINTIDYKAEYKKLKIQEIKNTIRKCNENN